jgi:hypothetical protein
MGLPLNLIALLGKTYPNVVRSPAALSPSTVRQFLSPGNLDYVQELLARRKRVDLTPLTSRRAAVLVPLCRVDNVPSVLFTVKDSSLRTHAGETRFAGCPACVSALTPASTTKSRRDASQFTARLS